MSPHFLQGGGAAGEAARAVDWSATALGPPERWPESLKTIVGVLLCSRHPMFLWWGEELIQFYNDAYMPSFGVGRHPQAMGQRGAECWQEIWPIIGPQIEDVMKHGRPSWHEDALVPIFRNHRIEEVYWTYGYSAVWEGDGKVGGTLVVCTETTARVLAARRLEFSRRLAIGLAAALDVGDVLRVVAATLEHAPHDVPFAIVDPGSGEPVMRVRIDAENAERVLRDARSGSRLSAPVAAGPWPEPVTDVFVAPIDVAGARIVFGLSPRLPFDDEARRFLAQIAEHASRARAHARVDSERRNLLEQAPVATALLTGPEHLFEIANPLYLTMVGRDVVGKTYLEAFPELRETELLGILDRVYREGVPFVTNEQYLPLDRGRGLEECYFKFNLEPLRRNDGSVYGMMAVAVEITDQVRVRQALEKTNDERQRLLAELETASRAKDEFLAMLGHELRNPLTPILTAIELIKVRGTDGSPREHEIIERQTRHLVGLVDDLLDVARVARGKIELRKARISLTDVVARALETTQPLFEEKQHAVVVDLPDDSLEVDADPLRLTQVVANLLSNAARYTDPHGRIEITAAREGERVKLSVRDNGIGIRADQLDRLFDTFFQGPRARDRAEGGLGLGLALVRTFVELHGGTVSVRSDGPGQGSCFEIELPCATLETPISKTTIAPVESKQLPAKRVLMVDDNADILETMALFLQTFGLDVRTAHDGPSALAALETFEPEVAVLDIGLPVMDGYELAENIRARHGEKAPRLIALTGYGQELDRENSRKAGFELHLTKPIDAYVLVEAVVGAAVQRS